jgi:predicted RND superfamily exporter protein
MAITVSERVGDFVVRITEKVVAHARVTIVLSWAIAILSGWGASHLQVFGDFSSLLPPNTESVVQLHALEKRTRVLATYMMGLESDDPVQRANAAAALRTRLEGIDRDLVAGVTGDEQGARQFAWNNRFLFAPLDELERARDALQKKIAEANPMYVSLDDDTPSSSPPSTDDLKERLDKAEKESTDPGAFVSKDARLQLFIVRTTFPSGDDERAHKLNALLEGAKRQTMAEFPAVTIGMAGDVITTAAEHRALVNGVLASTVATVGLVIGALFLFYRSLAAVGALCWSLTVGVLATFAFTKLTIGSLNLASAFLSSIVIGNGINFGLVLLARYQEERLREPNPDAALRAAVRGAAPGTLAAALTASVAYISLTVTPFRGFRDFGIIAAAGMVLCWVSAFTVLPSGLSMVGSRVKGADPSRFGIWIERIVPKRPRVVAALGMILLVLTTAATLRYLTHDPLEDDLRNLRSENAALDAEGAWMGKFDKAFGNGIEGGFIIGVDDPREAPIVADKLRKVDEGKPNLEHLFSRISTLDETLPKDQLAKIAVLKDIRESLDSRLLERLTDDEQTRLKKLRPPDGLRPLTIDDVPPELAWPYTERDGTRGRFVLANTGLGVDTWRVHALENFARVVRGLKLGPDVLVGGSAFVFSDMLAAMQRDGPRATVAAMVGSILVVLFVLGTGRYARITLACAGLGVTGMLTAGWILGIKVNFLDFVALPITIGIGVDYGVNIVARARQSSGPFPGRQALTTTGAVVVLCSYTTCVGYGSLLFSQNRGIHTFGLSAMIGELTCLSAAMLLAPTLIDYGAGAAKRSP